jgi:hypothetical protein
VGHHTEAFVGIDTSKLRNTVAIADSGRSGEVRYLGEFPATEAAIQKLVAKLAAKWFHTAAIFGRGETAAERLKSGPGALERIAVVPCKPAQRLSRP